MFLFFVVNVVVVVVYAVYVVVKCGCVDSTKTFRLGREKADLGSHLQEMEEELQVESHKQKKNNKQITNTQNERTECKQ